MSSSSSNNYYTNAGGGRQQPYAPSAPPQLAHPYQPPPPSAPSLPYAPIPPTNQQQQGYYGYNNNYYQNVNSGMFPSGTHPDVIRSFQMVDRNGNGYIEERELQEALALSYQKFSLRTLRLLIFLFKSCNESFSRIGPKEFAEVWSCLGQWRAIFERFDIDRSGRIDAAELRDALYSLGYALPPSVLQVLISRYDDGSGRRVELNFDSFIECGLIVKGLTEKFKEKDSRYTGSATLTYDTFMSMIIPFVV